MTDILPKSISILTARYCHLLIPFNANKSSLAKKSSHSILFLLFFSFHSFFLSLLTIQFLREQFSTMVTKHVRLISEHISISYPIKSLWPFYFFLLFFSSLSPSLPRTSCRLRPSSSFSFLLRSRFYFSVRVFFLLLLLLRTRTESRRIVDDALYDRFFFSFSLLSSSICLTHRKERKGICRGKKITTSFNASGT